MDGLVNAMRKKGLFPEEKRKMQPSAEPEAGHNSLETHTSV